MESDQNVYFWTSLSSYPLPWSSGPGPVPCTCQSFAGFKSYLWSSTPCKQRSLSLCMFHTQLLRQSADVRAVDITMRLCPRVLLRRDETSAEVHVRNWRERNVADVATKAVNQACWSTSLGAIIFVRSFDGRHTIISALQRIACCYKGPLQACVIIGKRSLKFDVTTIYTKFNHPSIAITVDVSGHIRAHISNTVYLRQRRR